MLRMIAQKWKFGEYRVSVVPDRDAHQRSQGESKKTWKTVPVWESNGRPLDYKHEYQERLEPQIARFLGIGGKYGRGWGLTPRKVRFTPKGRNTVIRCGNAMDMLGGIPCALTLTLPGSGFEAYDAMARWSSYIGNRVKTWLYDQIKTGEGCYWFYVWELQKRGALHLHFGLICPDMRVFYLIKEKVKEEWIKILESVEKKDGVPMFISPQGKDNRKRKKCIQVDFQRIRKSLGGYFSKYCSKGGSEVQQHVSRGLRPSQWWGCSRSLLRFLRTLRHSEISFPMSMSQVEERMQELSAAIPKDVVYHPGVNKYTGLPTAIIYSKREEVDNAFSRLIESFAECPSSRIEVYKMNEKEVKKAIKDLEKKWKDADERLRMAEVIGTDTPEWELLVRLVLEPDTFPLQIAAQVLETLRTEGKVNENLENYEDGFYINLDLSGLGA